MRKNAINRSIYFLVVVLMFSLLTGCISTSATNEPNSTTVKNNPGSTSADQTTRMTTTEKAVGSASFEEVTIANNEQCLVIVKTFEQDPIWGPTFNFYVENNSDKNLMYAINNASVNGFMCDPFWAEEVAAGKKANAKVSWSTTSLEEEGIQYINEVEFTLRVYDSDDWLADAVIETPVELVVVNSSDKPSTEPVLFEDGFTEQALASLEDAGVTAKTFVPDGDWGATLVLYLENNSDKELMYSINDASINGFMSDPFWATSVAAGKKDYADVNWSESTLAENAIETINTIEFTLSIHDANDFMADDIFNGVVTIEVGGG